jgi:hypothetical protein
MRLFKSHPNARRLAVWTLSALLLLVSAGLYGCATQSVAQFKQPFDPARHHSIRIERCVNRSNYTGRDIAAEATLTFSEKLRQSGLFEIKDDAPLVLTCDIEKFEEGSAYKRWLWPGWGATRAWVSVMVWEQPGDKVLAVMRSRSNVESGGLYTIGAEHYILGTAFDDIISQLKEWVGGKAQGR